MGLFAKKIARFKRGLIVLSFAINNTIVDDIVMLIQRVVVSMHCFLHARYHKISTSIINQNKFYETSIHYHLAVDCSTV